LGIDDIVWSHSSVNKNRDRLLEHDIIPALFEEIIELARKRDLLSEDHFNVDGTLIQAWHHKKAFGPILKMNRHFSLYFQIKIKNRPDQD